MDTCQQCGICCRKGGPAIHQEDKKLVDRGYIPLRFLFTIRKDEPVYDNIQGCIISASSDIIRIKGHKDSNRCVFFDPKHNQCTIYDYRPLECRMLQCWNTLKIKETYDKGRLSRQQLLAKSPHINDLIEYHENQCNYKTIQNLIHQLKHGDHKNAAQNIREILAFDINFRLLAIEKSVCKSDVMDFLFGLPLKKTLPRMGLRVIRKKDNHCLISLAHPGR